MRIEPLEDRVVVRQLDTATETAGGLIIPDMAREKPMQGEVIAVGPGKYGEDRSSLAVARATQMPVDVGDRVLYGRYSGTAVEVDGAEVLILRVSDILGRLVP